MDVEFDLRGIRFVWDAAKAAANLGKHGVHFEHAAEVFFDPLFVLLDASRNDEARDALTGEDAARRLLFVVHLIAGDDRVRLVSARRVTREERIRYEDG